VRIRGFLQKQTTALFCEKNLRIFRNLWYVRPDKGKGIESVRTFCEQGGRGEERFFTILCGRLLWTTHLLSDKLGTFTLHFFNRCSILTRRHTTKSVFQKLVLRRDFSVDFRNRNRSCYSQIRCDSPKSTIHIKILPCYVMYFIELYEWMKRNQQLTKIILQKL